MNIHQKKIIPDLTSLNVKGVTLVKQFKSVYKVERPRIKRVGHKREERQKKN